MKKLTLLLTAVALTGCPAPSLPPIELPASPSVKTFTASPTQVAAGAKATLTWSVDNATSVSLTQLDKGAITIDSTQSSGSVEVTVDGNATFVLTARGAGGTDQAIAAVGVTAPPSPLLFAAVPTEIAAGESSTLVWSAPGAKVVTITAAGTAVDLKGKIESGSVVVTPARDTTYEIDADGRKLTASVAVQPAIFSFGATSGSAMPGGMVTLDWKTGGASKLTLTREGVAAPLLVEMTADKIAAGTFVDAVPSALPPDAVLNYTLTIERNGMTVKRTAVVYVGVNPQILAFTMPAFGQQPGTFAVTWQTANADRVRISFDGLVVYDAPNAIAVAGGTLGLPTPAVKTIVELRVTNVRGGLTVQQKTIEPVGAVAAVEFKADKTSIVMGGEPVTLTWKVTNARRVKIEVPGQYDITNQVGLLDMGTIVVYPNRASTTYQLSADNQVGGAITPMTVTIAVGTSATFTLSNDPAPKGATIQITGHNVPNGTNKVIGLPNVTKNVAGEAFVDIANTGTDILYVGPDTTAKLVTLPAPFKTTVFGAPINADKLSVSINGWFMFSNTTVAGPDNPTVTIPPLPAPSLEPLSIAPYWEDLYEITANPLCKILVQVDPTPQGERLIVQWNEIEHDEFPGSKLTFQAQVFSSGKIVFAYKTLQGLTGPDEVSLGVVNADESDAVAVNVRPAEGDTYSFFTEVTLPTPIKVPGTPIKGFLKMPDNGLIELINTVLNKFVITEVNFNPVAGKDEWVEVTNKTASAISLTGWTIDLGAAGTHVITGPLSLPANGRIILGQSADATEASAGGPTVDYVYGTTLAMPNAAGSVSISLGGASYTRTAWTAAGTAGVALQADPPRSDLIFATGVTELTCGATTPYGAAGQLGTPKAVNPSCFPWVSAAGTGTYQSILATGTPVGTMIANGTLNSSDNVAIPLDFTAAGGRAVKIAGGMFGNATNRIYVMSDGFLSLLAGTSSSANPTIPATTAPNAVAAIFWDDLSANSAASGVYWQQFDPDAVPLSGDEYTLISWENWRRYSATATNLSSLNFQIKLHEATGDLEYIFGAMSATTVAYANGANATTWLEAVDGKSAMKINVNSATAPGIQPNTAFRFVYTP